MKFGAATITGSIVKFCIFMIEVASLFLYFQVQLLFEDKKHFAAY